MAISLWGVIILNPRRFYYSCAWYCSLCERRTFFCTVLISENSRKCGFLLMFSLLHSVSYFFFLYQSPLSLCLVFDSILSNIDEIFSINPSANVFVFGNFNVHHKVWLTYSGGTDRPGTVFLSQMILLRWLTFLLSSQTDSHSSTLLDLFLSSVTSICSTMAFPLLRNSDHVVVTVSIDFPINSK